MKQHDIDALRQQYAAPDLKDLPQEAKEYVYRLETAIIELASIRQELYEAIEKLREDQLTDAE